MTHKLCLIIVVTMLLASCSTQTFNVSGMPMSKLRTDNMQTFFISGLGQEQKIDAGNVCGGPERVAKVQVKQTFLDGLLGGLTLGIYTPRTAKVFCTS